MSEIRFDDITPIEELVHIGGIDYVLKETSGDASVKYDNARLACYEYQDGKLVRSHGLADLEPLLISLCLFDSAGVNVPETVIRSWPSRIQQALYTRAKMVSGTIETVESLEGQLKLLQKQLVELQAREQAPKNSPSDTEVGSG
ncbi:MAG: hypothetical protein ABIH76_04500 [Candidatus Bathyarchaeota archaeon]